MLFIVSHEIVAPSVDSDTREARKYGRRPARLLLSPARVHDRCDIDIEFTRERVMGVRSLLQFSTRATSLGDDHSFYDMRQAARLASVPPSTLGYWIHHGVARPSRRVVGPDKQVVAEGFSFSDLGYLRLLRHLRGHGIPMEDAVGLLVHLMDRLGPPSPKWRDARVFIDGKRVYVNQPDDWETTQAQRRGGGQRLFETFVGEAFTQLKDRADSVLVPNEYLEDVEIDPNIADGMPVIRDTRVETAVVRARARGMSPHEIVKRHYPFVTPQQVDSAIRYEEYLDTRAA